MDASSGTFCNVCVLLQCVIADAFCCQACPCIDCTEIIFVEGNGLGGRGAGRGRGGERERPQFGTRGRRREVGSGLEWPNFSFRYFGPTWDILKDKRLEIIYSEIEIVLKMLR